MESVPIYSDLTSAKKTSYNNELQKEVVDTREKKNQVLF